MNDYTVIVGRADSIEKAIDKLVAKVNAQVSAGWQPAGGITIDRTSKPVHSQHDRRGYEIPAFELEVICLQPMVR